MTNKDTIIIGTAHEFPEGGAAARCIHMLAKGFTGEGRDVLVASLYGSWEDPADIVMDGFKVTSFGDKRRQGKSIYDIFNRVKAHIRLCLCLLQATILKKYSLMIFYGPVLSFPVIALCAIILKQKTAYLMADIRPKTSNIPIGLKIKYSGRNVVDILLARFCDRIIVLGTTALQKHYLSVAPKTKQIRIWAPTDTHLFSMGDSTRAEQRYEIHNTKNICYAGTVDMLEGVHILIRAITMLSKKCPQVRLIIAGKERSTDRVIGTKVSFTEMVAEEGISEKVIFTGYLHFDNLIDLYAASDILVMPKIDHPMNHVASPIKIAEYLAAGRATIASRICELDSILTHKEDILFCSPGDVKELAESIETILFDKELKTKLARNASVAAKKYFDYTSCAKKILSECL